MTHRARALISLAAVGFATPAFACPGMYSCVPIECLVPTPTSVPDRNPTRPQSGGSGLQAFASRNVTLQSQVTLAQMGGGSGSSLYGWVDPQTRREYAIMGRSSGTSFIDITNPTSPIVVANLPKVATASNTSWREPKVYQNTVYIGVDGTNHGMQVMDLTKLRNYAGTTMTLTSDSVYTGVTKIHTLGINPESGYLYLAGTNVNSGGLRVLDVRNPMTPVVAGNTNLDGYTHETQVVTYRGPDLAHRGKEIALNSNGPSGVLSILDVTNKSAITRIAARSYTGERYIHQGWLTEDQRYFFQNDELDEPSVAPRTRTHLWDLADLDNPVYRGFFDHQTTSVDHNLYVKGNYVYETNYTTGLRILKIGDLTSNDSSQWLTEVAFFDTYMANDGSSFNGAWNNYPYFPSGNIAVSDINGGLFVLRASLPPDVPIDLINNPIPKFGPGGFVFNSIPEPGSLGLLAGAALVLALRRRGARR
jgi:choice-of-anchor B domain-containing protein